MGVLTVVTVQALSVHCVATEGYVTDDLIVVRIKRRSGGVTQQSVQLGPFKLNSGQDASLLTAPALLLDVSSDPPLAGADDLQIELTDIDCPSNDCWLDTNDPLGTVTMTATQIATDVGPGLVAIGTAEFTFKMGTAHYVVHVQAETQSKVLPPPAPSATPMPPKKQIELEIQELQKELARSALLEVKKVLLSSNRSGWPATFSADPGLAAPSQAEVVEMLAAEMLEHLQVDFSHASYPNQHLPLGARFLPAGCTSGLYREWIRRNVLGWAAAMAPLLMDGKFSVGQFVLGASSESRSQVRRTAADFAEHLKLLEDNGRDLFAYNPAAFWGAAGDPGLSTKAATASVADLSVPVAQAQANLQAAFHLVDEPKLDLSWNRMSWLETMFHRAVTDGLGLGPVAPTQGVSLDLRGFCRMLLQLFDRPVEALTVFAHHDFIAAVDAAAFGWNTDLPGTLGWCVTFRDDTQLKPRMKAYTTASAGAASQLVASIKEATGGGGSVFLARNAAHPVTVNAQYKTGQAGSAAESFRATIAVATAAEGANAVGMANDLVDTAVLPVSATYHYNTGGGFVPGVGDPGVHREGVALWTVRPFDVYAWNPVGPNFKPVNDGELPLVSSGLPARALIERFLAYDGVVIVLS